MLGLGFQSLRLECGETIPLACGVFSLRLITDKLRLTLAVVLGKVIRKAKQILAVVPFGELQSVWIVQVVLAIGDDQGLHGVFIKSGWLAFLGVFVSGSYVLASELG